jgi:hypothetical protein
MRLFAPDLYRNFAIGFVVGGLLIAGGTIDQWGQQLESPAHAADNVQPAMNSPDSFLATGIIAPE